MRPNPDLQLVQRASGDKRAFRTIVEQTQSMVYSVAYRFLRDIHESEDAVQDVYMRLWQNLDRYDGSSRLSTWLYRITTNLCLDRLRKRKQSTTEIENDFQDPEPLVSDRMDQKELIERIHRAASELMPKQQAAFILRDLEGIETAEACEILNITEGQLKSNLYYARKKIKELLQHERNEYGL